MEFSPKEIVEKLDEVIIGQDEAKRTLAIALRNRWRRQQLSTILRKEISPKNILMIGDTGTGKTALIRALATIISAPMVKVEATKYTQVGYVGGSVDDMVSELVDVAKLCLDQRLNKEKVRTKEKEKRKNKTISRLTSAQRPLLEGVYANYLISYIFGEAVGNIKTAVHETFIPFNATLDARTPISEVVKKYKKERRESHKPPSDEFLTLIFRLVRGEDIIRDVVQQFVEFSIWLEIGPLGYKVFNSEKKFANVITHTVETIIAEKDTLVKKMKEKKLTKTAVHNSIEFGLSRFFDSHVSPIIAEVKKKCKVRSVTSRQIRKCYKNLKPRESADFRALMEQGASIPEAFSRISRHYYSDAIEELQIPSNYWDNIETEKLISPSVTTSSSWNEPGSYYGNGTSHSTKDLLENHGIIFIDEIDKLAESTGGGARDNVGKTGVQRDLLALLDGTTVHTKHGTVSTENILFIAAGAFHVSKPTDLMPELLGRLPIRVQLEPMSVGMLERILFNSKNSPVEQYNKLLETEGYKVTVTPEAMIEMANLANDINVKLYNLGARTLHKVIDVAYSEVSYTAFKGDSNDIIDYTIDMNRMAEVRTILFGG